MTRFVDLTADGAPVGRCVVLPGRRYTPDGPLLFFAAQAALMRGWDVRQVWWEVPQLDTDAEELAWVGSQLKAAVDGHGGASSSSPSRSEPCRPRWRPTSGTTPRGWPA